MRPSVTRPKLFLAILALLVAIFACTALLRAQNLPQKHEPDTRQQYCSASKWAALRVVSLWVFSLEFKRNATLRTPEKASSRHLHRCKGQGKLGSGPRGLNI